MSRTGGTAQPDCHTLGGIGNCFRRQPFDGLPNTIHRLNRPEEDKAMHSLIYIVGLVVVIVFVLSLLGLA